MATEVPATAVVVTYNSARTIRAALSALRRCHEAGAARTIVVDNASSDETRSMLAEHAEWATIVQSPTNIGFGRGCNLGLARVTTRFVVFVNPDAELEPGPCMTLSAFLDAHPEAGMAAPMLVESDGAVQHFGGLPTPGKVLRQALGKDGAGLGRRVVAEGSKPFLTDWVCGALFMAPVAVLRQLGGFDEHFFLYFEETDLCRRISEAGREIWAIPEVVADHIGGASAVTSDQARVGGCIAEHYYRSRFYYLRKHFGLAAATGTELGELLLLACRATSRWARGRSVSDLTRRFRCPILQSPAPPQ